MNKFTFTLYFAFIASILLAGCTAPAHLRHTSELSQEEKMQQTIDAWKGRHISKAIQKWGAPNEVNGDGTGWQIYIWYIPVHRFLAKQEPEHKGFLLRRDPQTYLRRDPRDIRGVAETYFSTGYSYQLTFYARPNGIISKTLVKKNYDPASEFQWK